MRIGLLSLNQTVNDRPYRFISKRDAKLGLIRKTLKRHSKKLYQEVILNAIPPPSLTRYNIPKLNIVQIPPVPLVISKAKNNNAQASILIQSVLKPSTTLVLYYPVKDQSSYSQRDLQAVWGCNQDEWQRRIGAS